MKRMLLGVFVLLASTVTYALPDPVVVHEEVVASGADPFMTGTFGANVKKGEAWLTVSVTRDSNESEEASTGVETTSFTAENFPLTLRGADVVYTAANGESVACARVVTHSFLGLKFRKVRPTGHCEFSTVLEALGSGRTRATLDVEFK